MKVRALAWNEWNQDLAFAETEFGCYMAHGETASCPNEIPVYLPTHAEARAACQSDFERRVMACIELNEGST